MNLRKYSMVLAMVAACIAACVVACILASCRTLQAAEGQQAKVARVFGITRGGTTGRATAGRDDAGAASAFEAMTAVLRHPRCMNCHSSGDFPRQGDDGHPHTMNVRRGVGGEGVPAVKCGSCHQDHNLEGRRVPPGAPGWRLPPAAMPMIWEGLNNRQLCELFKDPRQNGHRNVNEIVKHMTTPLVLWGWNPGEGRTPIPMPQAEFLAKVKEWVAKGAACPVP